MAPRPGAAINQTAGTSVGGCCALGAVGWMGAVGWAVTLPDCLWATSGCCLCTWTSNSSKIVSLPCY